MMHPLTRRQLAAGLACWAGAACGSPAALADADAAQVFRALRGVRGRFDGGAWNDAVDRWQGTKHLAMQTLAAQMLQRRATAAQLRREMGAPDAVLAPGAADHARAREAVQWPEAMPPDDRRAGARLWLYRWRGSHDQLALALVQGRVVAVGWLHAWE